MAFLNDSKTYPHQYLFYRNRTADMNLDEGDVDADMLSRTRIFHFGSFRSHINDVEKLRVKSY